MRSRSLTVATALVGLAVAVGVVPAAAAAPAPAAAAEAPPVKDLEVTSTVKTITMADGTKIGGTLSVPTSAAPAGGWPTVVLGGTFGGTVTDATVFGSYLAKRGYVVLSYYERGFGTSGGEIDGAGPKDTADMRALITWTLAQAKTNPNKVGVGGLSYGAGIALIVGEQDRRVKSVMALSGWADMGQTFYSNKTANTLSLQVLYGIASNSGRPSAEMTAAFDALNKGDYATGLKYTAPRGAVAYRKLINASNAPALFMSEGVNETVFPILSTTKYFEDYPGRKRIELRAGDHAGPESSTTFGVVSTSWDQGFRWFDNTLAGYDTSMLNQPSVVVEPRSNAGAKPLETYSTTVNNKNARVFVSGQPRAFFSNDSGTLTDTAGTRTTKLAYGQEWFVRNGVPEFTYAVECITGIPPTVALGMADPNVTGIFRSPALATAVQLRGEIKPHLQITPSAAKGTVVVHVLDIGKTGTAYAVAHHPYSWDDATPGKAMTIDFALPYNMYDFPVGDRIVVTVSSSDTTYAGLNAPGSSFVLGADSYVDFPLK